MACGDTDSATWSPSSGSTPRAARRCSNTRGGDRQLEAQITDAKLLAATQALNRADPEDSVALCVQEFTTVIDDRETPPMAVGFRVELAEPLGASTRSLDASTDNGDLMVDKTPRGHQHRARADAPLDDLHRRGRHVCRASPAQGEFANVVAGRIKVPLVLVQPEVQAWFLERAVREL
ncbi:hypothetical protein OG21DRAFT_1484266 [Imleria badia]|nr:hypothetical protein OG21DRAFT_1484266 [Imleria badia]